jgi:hypothetical protein
MATSGELFGDRLSQVDPGLTDTQYQSLKSTCSRRFRLQMKRELLQHFRNVSLDTWLYLLSNRWRAIKRRLHLSD